MTWGTKDSDQKQPPPAYTSTPPLPGAFVPVSSQYEHHPKKSVLAVSGIILIAGFFCLGLGISREAMGHYWDGIGLGNGVFFMITGILGIVSVFKRTKCRLIATAVLALMATLAAAWLCSHISSWYWSRDDEGDMVDRWDRRAGDGDRKERKRERERERREEEDLADWILGVNGFMFFFSLLVFCCSIPLTVFSLRTVTSPRNGPPADAHLTPVVAFPYSKDPNQLDSFNGNDYI